MNFRCIKKNGKEIVVEATFEEGGGSFWLLFDDACALEGKVSRRDCLPWSDTELRGE